MDRSTHHTTKKKAQQTFCGCFVHPHPSSGSPVVALRRGLPVCRRGLFSACFWCDARLLQPGVELPSSLGAWEQVREAPGGVCKRVLCQQREQPACPPPARTCRPLEPRCSGGCGGLWQRHRAARGTVFPAPQPQPSLQSRLPGSAPALSPSPLPGTPGCLPLLLQPILTARQRLPHHFNGYKPPQSSARGTQPTDN